MNFFVVPAYLGSILVILSLLGMFFFRKQFLIILLSMELVLLTLFILIMLLYSNLGHSISLSFYVLILGACEASLGLSLLVMMTRLKGSDMLSLFLLSKC